MRLFLVPSLAGLAALALPALANARSVDYSLPPAAIIAGGQELKITPLTSELHPAIRIDTVTAAPAVDHVNLSLARFCSAYKVENPISQLFAALKAEWNAAADSAAGAPLTPVRLTIDSASSYRRCVEVAEMNVRCITKVRIAGTVTSGDAGAPVAVTGEAERDASVGGLCGNLARGVGVVSREAAIALMRDAESKLAAH